MLPAFLPLLCSSHTLNTDTTVPIKGNEDWTLRRYSSEDDLKRSWPVASREDNFWLAAETLAFQFNHPQGLRTEGLLLHNRLDQRQVLLTAQTYYFNAAGQVSDTAKGETSSYDMRRKLLSPFSFKVLCIGQFLTSGTFSQDGLQQLSATEAAELLPAVASTLMTCSPSYVAVLLKDLYPLRHPATRALTGKGFHLLPCDPAMRLNIADDWRTTDDYLSSLTSKYRVRYRRARGKLTGISRRRLSSNDVIHFRDQIYQLYRSTSTGADFNAANLTPEYFPWLAKDRKVSKKSAMPAEILLEEQHGFFREEADESVNNLLFGYFNVTGELIGFTSAIPNGRILHAHYLGLENSYKHSHHLYHNMLFDLLDDAIEGGFGELDYGRTALEIKSSIGARAKDYACLLMARPWLINRLIPVFTPAVYSAPQWTSRNPFGNRQNSII